MDISLFRAQAFGLYFVIVGLGLVLNQSALKSVVTRFSSDRTSVMMGGFIALLIGIPLVLVHNVWMGTWEILVTVLVWVTLLKGVTLVLMPDMVVRMAKRSVPNSNMLKMMLWVMVALGAYLLYVGFGM